jgi:hypothetical protein
MSGATHTQIPVRQQLLRDDRRARLIALAVVAAVAALAVTLILILAGDDPPSADPAQSTQQPAVQQVGSYPSPENVPESLRPGTRYDGGPEEGTRGSTSFQVLQGAERYDGGPQEGTRGPGH